MKLYQVTMQFPEPVELMTPKTYRKLAKYLNLVADKLEQGEQWVTLSTLKVTVDLDDTTT